MRSMWLLCLLVLAACGDDDPTSPTPTYSMQGTWSVPITFTGAITLTGDPTSYPISCSGTVTAVIQDASGALTGTSVGFLTCTLLGGTGTYDMTGDMTGTRSKSSVTLAGGVCHYQGKLTSETAASGTGGCDQATVDGALHMAGNWTATKQ